MKSQHPLAAPEPAAPAPPALSALLLAALLSACGGGSDSNADTRRLQAVSSAPAASASAEGASAAPGETAPSAPAAAASSAVAARLVAAPAPGSSSAPGANSTISATRVKAAAAPATPNADSAATSPTGASPAAGNSGLATGSLQSSALASTTEAPAAVLPATILTTGKLLAGVDVNRTLSSYRWIWSLECAGKVLGATAVPEDGIFGTADSGSEETLRFGKTADPLAAARQVLMFKARRDDPKLSGAPRCEMTFSPTQAGRLPIGKDFWFAFGLHLPDWKPSSDEQIIAQWHQANGSVPLNPFFAISVQGDGVRFQARQDASESVSKATVGQPIDFLAPGLPIKNWAYFVVKARISPDPAKRPFLQVWRNGALLFNYSGPLGYNISSSAPFAKIGHYHWIDSSNPWPASIPSRTVMFRAPTFVEDDAGLYGAEDLRGYVMKN